MSRQYQYQILDVLHNIPNQLMEPDSDFMDYIRLSMQRLDDEYSGVDSDFKISLMNVFRDAGGRFD